MCTLYTHLENMRHAGIITLLIGMIYIESGMAFKCYTCDDIQTSEDCMNVTDCSPNEMCYIRADGLPSGEVRHSLGCTNDDALIATDYSFCSETCNTDFCNLNGCRLPVSPTGQPKRSPRCLSCDLISSPAACKKRVQCNENEVCFSRAITIYGKVLYRLGCLNKQHCSDHPIQTGFVSTNPPTIVGKRSSSGSSCSICCTTDFCNVQDCQVQRDNGTGHDLHLLGDNQTCFDSNPGACSSFGLLNKDACTVLPSVDAMCPETCGICGHYGWASWGSWDACSRTCDEGTSQRKRNCMHQIAVAEQFNCSGIATETRTCRTKKCDVEGTWSSWEAWGTCSSSCGNGTKSRQRYCKNTSLQHGNLYCTGDNIEETACENWIKFEGSCYYFGPVSMAFSSALRVCVQKGSTLIHINSDRENTFVSNHIKQLHVPQNNGTNWWIGVTDIAHEGHWILTGTNTEASYTNWAPGEPSNNGFDRDEDCAAIMGNYTWNDENCDYSRNRPVCEK